MNWYPILFGVITGIISIVIFQLLPKKLNVWLRGIISIIIITLIAFIVRLIFGIVDIG